MDGDARGMATGSRGSRGGDRLDGVDHQNREPGLGRWPGPGRFCFDRRGVRLGLGVTAEGISRLDDQDYPAVTMGQAAQLLGVQPAFLRSLDAAGVVVPDRSQGGHRRYSRRQLGLAARLRELFDEGMTLDAAARIVALQDELAATREELAATCDELDVTRAQELDVAREQLAAARARVAELEDRADPTGA